MDVVSEPKKVVWNPLVARLADAEVKQGNSNFVDEDDALRLSEIKARWAAATKRRSSEEFEKYIHDLFISDL